MRETSEPPVHASRTTRNPAARELSRGDPGYPALLAPLDDAPDPLYVHGHLRSEAPAVAIVGARACTRYGRDVAGRLASDLAGRGVVVVSGLAHGIDGVAHTATVRARGSTIAVLPGGLDRPYPARHRALARSILRDGALVTEHPPGTEVGPWSFPRRNRIIAGLAHLVVVVEAAERSGARITAGLALDYGREVLVVPGPVTSRVSRGCHALLSEGAHPCTGIEDVLGLLPPEALARIGAPVDAAAEDPAGADARPEERRLLRALATRDTASIDELHACTRMPLATLLSVLTGMELRGWIRVRGDRVDLIRSPATDKQ